MRAGGLSLSTVASALSLIWPKTAVVTATDRALDTNLYDTQNKEASTEWLPNVEKDTSGFVLTGPDVETPALHVLGRERLPFESSIPGIFAVGDARHGSMKRVAAAVGEGSSAVASVHRALAFNRVKETT